MAVVSKLTEAEAQRDRAEQAVANALEYVEVGLKGVRQRLPGYVNLTVENVLDTLLQVLAHSWMGENDAFTRMLPGNVEEWRQRCQKARES